MDAIKNAVGGKLDKSAQPGNSVETKADSSVNDKIDGFASKVGVPQGDDKVINDFADKKVNGDIPGGN